MHIINVVFLNAKYIQLNSDFDLTLNKLQFNIVLQNNISITARIFKKIITSKLKVMLMESMSLNEVYVVLF